MENHDRFKISSVLLDVNNSQNMGTLKRAGANLTELAWRLELDSQGPPWFDAPTAASVQWSCPSCGLFHCCIGMHSPGCRRVHLGTEMNCILLPTVSTGRPMCWHRTWWKHNAKAPGYAVHSLQWDMTSAVRNEARLSQRNCTMLHRFRNVVAYKRHKTLPNCHFTKCLQIE